MRKLNNDAWERIFDIIDESYGATDIINELFEYIKKNRREHDLEREQFAAIFTERFGLQRPPLWGMDGMLNFLWQLFVLEFGDYGVSVRVGWVNIDNADEFVEFLNKWYIKYLRRDLLRR